MLDCVMLLKVIGKKFVDKLLDNNVFNYCCDKRDLLAIWFCSVFSSFYSSFVLLDFHVSVFVYLFFCFYVF